MTYTEISKHTLYSSIFLGDGFHIKLVFQQNVEAQDLSKFGK